MSIKSEINNRREDLINNCLRQVYIASLRRKFILDSQCTKLVRELIESGVDNYFLSNNKTLVLQQLNIELTSLVELLVSDVKEQGGTRKATFMNPHFQTPAAIINKNYGLKVS